MRSHNSIEISKREYEVIQFLQTGSNFFWDAYYLYASRKKKIDRDLRVISSWFNKTLEGLHKKGIFKEVPFAHRMPNGKYMWINPGLNTSKANFECITLQETNQETRYFINKVI